MRKHWRIGLLGGLVSLLAIYFIVSELNLTLMQDALARARFIYVLPCIALLLLGLLTRAMRWHLLLNRDLSYWRSFHVMNVAYLVNGVLPLRIGEVARVYLATRREKPTIPQTASTIVVERLLDLLGVVLLVALALVAGPVPEQLRVTGAIFGVLSLVGFIVLVFLSHQRGFLVRLLAITTGILTFLPHEQLETWLHQFLDGLKPLAGVRTLAAALLWTAASWGLSVAAGYVLMFTFYEQASWAATCLYIAAAAFAIAVPAVPGNLGTYELSIIVALEAVGYGEPAAVAAAFAVTVHVVNVAVHAVTGVVGFIEEGISLGQLREGVRDVTEASEAYDISEAA